jgi:hypothetical protein
MQLHGSHKLLIFFVANRLAPAPVCRQPGVEDSWRNCSVEVAQGYFMRRNAVSLTSWAKLFIK